VIRDAKPEAITICPGSWIYHMATIGNATSYILLNHGF
jgi:hypothetical protein